MSTNSYVHDAKVLIEVAEKSRNLSQAVQDLQDILVWLRDLPALRQYLMHPGVTDQEKKELLEFSREISPVVLAYVLIISKQRRLNNLADVLRAIQRIARQQGLLVIAEVSTAYKANEAMEKTVIELLQLRGTKEVVIKKRIDPKLGGGVVIRTPEFVIDRSLRGGLQRLREELIAT